MKHAKYHFVKTLMEERIPVMLEGEAGSGKTTLIMDIAKALNLKFHSITGTQQTSVANLIGFKTVNGTDSTTQLREAYEFGGIYLIDEYDGMNPNTILALNSIENGFISFPDKVVYGHKDFILCATINPDDQHASFTGRSVQDRAALDRFIRVEVERDSKLELNLTSKETVQYATYMRKLLHDNGVTSRVITMRDSMRFHKLQQLKSKGKIKDDPLDTLIGKNVELASKIKDYKKTIEALNTPISSTTNIDELYDLLKRKGSK